MRRAARTDTNHREVVAALRAVGCSVSSLAAVGQGVPDLLVGVSGATLLVEVKDGSRSPSERRLTACQQSWMAEWRGGPVAVVDSAEAAVRAVVALRASHWAGRGTHEGDEASAAPGASGGVSGAMDALGDGPERGGGAD